MTFKTRTLKERRPSAKSNRDPYPESRSRWLPKFNGDFFHPKVHLW